MEKENNKENKQENVTIATEVLKLLKNEYKKEINRLYGIIIIVIVLFVISISDSIYQRCRIIKVIEEYDRHCVQEIAENNDE